MDINLDLVAKLLAPVITLIGIIAKKYLEVKPKLVTYLVHSSTISIGDQVRTHFNTHSIVVRNAGKKTANNIRIGHRYLPAYQIFPQLNHEKLEGSNGSVEILIPTLVPNEQINISYLYFPPFTWDQIHAYCKSDEMTAEYVGIVPTIPPTRLQLTIVWTLILTGATTIFYWAIYLILHWAQQTNME